MHDQASMTPESTEPRTAAQDTFTRLVNDVLDKWLGIATPDHEWDVEADDLWNRMTDAGLLATIAPTEPGRVVIEWNTIEVALLDMDYAHMTAYEITHRIMQALDAAAERAATGGA